VLGQLKEERILGRGVAAGQEKLWRRPAACRGKPGYSAQHHTDDEI
jgi:hypothetical protein